MTVIRAEIEKIAPSNIRNMPTPSEKRKKFDIFRTNFEELPQNSAEHEIENYMNLVNSEGSSGFLDVECFDVVKWWKQKEQVAFRQV